VAPYQTTATFQDLERFLAESGCCICRVAAQAERRYFDGLLYEEVVTPATAEAMRASGGYCARHVGVLLGRRDPLATALLYGYVLSARRAELDRVRRGPRALWPGRAGSRPAAHRCPACRVEQEAVDRAAQVLALGLEDGSLAGPWRRSEGLCWPHFLGTRTRCRAAGREVLDAVEADRLARLAAEVEALVQSFDYRHEGERPAEVATAWRRLVATMAGRDGGGPWEPRP
jgi:hypothetical protein